MRFRFQTTWAAVSYWNQNRGQEPPTKTKKHGLIKNRNAKGAGILEHDAARGISYRPPITGGFKGEEKGIWPH